MLSFSETFFLKTTRPIALISLLVFHVQKSDGGAHRHDCLNCKHQPNVCKFLLVLEAQILDTGAEKCRSKTFSIPFILGFALRSTPLFHRHFIIHPVLFILCLINVKRVVSFDHSSCIYHMFIYWISSLFMCEPSTVCYELFIQVVTDESCWSILGYLFYVHQIRVSCVIFAIHLITC